MSSTITKDSKYQIKSSITFVHKVNTWHISLNYLSPYLGHFFLELKFQFISSAVTVYISSRNFKPMFLATVPFVWERAYNCFLGTVVQAIVSSFSIPIRCPNRMNGQFWSEDPCMHRLRTWRMGPKVLAWQWLRCPWIDKWCMFLPIISCTTVVSSSLHQACSDTIACSLIGFRNKVPNCHLP